MPALYGLTRQVLGSARSSSHSVTELHGMLLRQAQPLDHWGSGGWAFPHMCAPNLDRRRPHGVQSAADNPEPPSGVQSDAETTPNHYWGDLIMPRNTANKSHLSAFCTPSLVARLDTYAEHLHCSRSQALRILLEDGLARHALGLAPRPPHGPGVRRSVNAELELEP